MLPLGSRRLQAPAAARNRDVFSSIPEALSWSLTCPWASGSGKLGSPWERMQREYASICDAGDSELVDSRALALLAVELG